LSPLKEGAGARPPKFDPAHRPVERGKRVESFPWPRDVWWARLSLKNTGNGVQDGFFLTESMHKIHFRPDPAGELRNLPLTSRRMVRGHPSPRFLPLDAFGVSISRHAEWGDRVPG